MTANRLPMRLQTKIISANILITLFVIVIFLIISFVIEYKQVEKQMGNQALQLAKVISSIPSVVSSFEDANPSQKLQPLMTKISEETGAEFIVIGNTEGVRYAHPEEEKIGLPMVGGDNEQALNGEYYVSKAKGSMGRSIRGKGPIINEAGQLVGIISVGYLMSDLRESTLQRWEEMALISFIVVLIGVIASYFVARNIQNTTLGLEPYEMTSLYLERNAILYSIKEGIIAVDKTGRITMINQSAKDLLGINKNVVYQKIESVLPHSGIYKVLETREPDRDHEITLKNKSIIINRTPIIENDQVIGVVATFRDKTEFNKMIEELSEVKKYSEDLRAQTHEFSNKLYVLSGLLQLEKYEEAIQMIQEASNAQEAQNKIIFEQLLEPKIQALLLGKLGKASEKKVDFIIDENSHLENLPAHFTSSAMISILGNLIDNAFEAVEGKTDGKVTFFAIDVGEDLIIEIEDNGHGISDEQISQIFEIGYSTKGMENRGFGLPIVKQAVENLNGTIEVRSKKGDGTLFTLYLPKKEQEL